MNKKESLENVKSFLELLEGVENVRETSDKSYTSLDFTLVQYNVLHELVTRDFFIIFHDTGRATLSLDTCKDFSIKCNTIKELTTLIQHIEID